MSNNMFDTPIKDWYAATFDDPIVEDMPYYINEVADRLQPYIDRGLFFREDPITFATYMTALREGVQVYNLMGRAADSVVRERIFMQLSEMTEIDYDAIYNMWLRSGD